MRDVCDAAEAQGRPRSSDTLPATRRGAAQSSNDVSTYTGGRFSCLCRHRRRFRRRIVVRGSLTLSFETTNEQHLPGCPATQVIAATDRSQKFSLTYTGLRHALNAAIQLSFAMPWGAGAWSLTPNFTYYPTVDSEIAPAFRILSLLEMSQIYFNSWEELVPLAESAILRLFRAKKASPRAVDGNNRSLVWYLARCVSVDRLPACMVGPNSPTQISFSPGSFKRRLPSRAGPGPLLDLLECLLLNKTPANDYDLSGG